MKIAFLMDPLHSVVMEKDTTFILMFGAHNRGHEVHFLPKGGITAINGKLHLHCKHITPQKDRNNPFQIHDNKILKEDEIDAVFIRPDPPFNYEYLMNTWLLDHLADCIPVINHPHGIRTVNEKVWSTRFTSIMPPTLIGRNAQDLKNFLKEYTEIIAKPTDQYGGKSVFRIKVGDQNSNVILETISNNYQQDIILQKYINEASQGDKRILLLDGNPLGAVLRVHAADDYRNNFFSGGKPQATEITQRDLEIIEILRPQLKKLGLHFVGIDVIGEYLIEVNVTSPTCLQEINNIQNAHLEDKVIIFVENCVEEYKSRNKINACRPPYI